MIPIESIAYGFQVAFQLDNVFCCFVGVLFGTLVGVLPGFGPTAGVALLLPISYTLSPSSAIILLAGIYYGSMYGGSTTSVLVNIPGEAASVVTCIDGYQMALQGKAGPALAVSAIGSFIAGTIGVVLLMFIALPLGDFGLKFGPAEFFSLIVVAVVLLTYLSSKSLTKSLIMGVTGLFLSTIGIDVFTSAPRFTFGIFQLQGGLDFVPVVMGLFGISEILLNVEKSVKVEIIAPKISRIFLNREEWKRSIFPITRGTFLGFFLGMLPGGGAIISSFASYSLEKKLSKKPEEFGRGAIEGVAGPESANNSATAGGFVPLLSLGIPPNVVMALFLGGLMMHGVVPGPLLIKQHPDVFWGIISSMYLGNIFLLILNLPLVGIWVKLLRIRYNILFPLIIVFCLMGVYSLNGNIFDIYTMAFFGAAGYFLRKLDFDLAPLVLAMVLGPILEENFGRALIISGGSFLIFIQKPISGFFLFVAFFLLATIIFPEIRKFRAEVTE